MMKRIKTVLISIICIACSPDDENTNISITEENVVVSQNEIYENEFVFPGDEAAYSITRQAENFEISSIEQDSTTGNFFYSYKPKADFTGSDSVEISLTTYAIGLDQTSIARIIRINFEVQK